ncbi:SRPBCC family protein [Terricaulis sp.]|uniref:SRPBCC family protein n=1 Tax=Terricaulis sp. TaxID=2768686 RepID=UPI002AC3EF44|nr:SRPBCC family protein [Terricaulis sp.]MDZ4693270.1 SRPBCC family protein [Terricaulis sp.]
MELGRFTAPDTFVLERRLKAPIHRVWSYFVDGEKRARWFTGGDTLSANGQAFSILFAHRNITTEKPPERWKQMETGEFPMTGRVLAFDPPHVLAITWGDGNEAVSEVRFEFKAIGHETLLTLTHSKIDTNAALRDFAGGWTAHVETLVGVLDGKPTNRFWADVLAAHEAYEGAA